MLPYYYALGFQKIALRPREVPLSSLFSRSVDTILTEVWHCRWSRFFQERMTLKLPAVASGHGGRMYKNAKRYLKTREEANRQEAAWKAARREAAKRAASDVAAMLAKAKSERQGLIGGCTPGSTEQRPLFCA